jgi:hypothetical protein
VAVAGPEDFIEEVAGRADEDVPRRARWVAAATLLAIALLLQIGHRHRAELAVVPALERPIEGLYAALGHPIVPRWDLDAYEVQQNGVFADGGAATGASGTLELRASIRNRGDRPQPAPLLRVVLEDRFANRIAARDVDPAEYLRPAADAPGSPAEPARIAPGRRLDATVTLVDPGGNAVGFEIDVCLRRTGGTIECANDAAGAAP